jgi:hypothetical protein
VLKKGLIKRVGPDLSINIWQDNWIPGIQNYKPRVHLPEVTMSMVDDLFVPGERCWDVERVYQSFISIDAEEILKIQPSRTMEEDVMAWAYERSGGYSVRSAYRQLKGEQSESLREKEGGAASSVTGKWWRVLWKLKVPPKVRIFWWRVIRNFLPSNAELKRRDVSHESHYAACGHQSEDLFHVIVECPWAKRLWLEVKKLTGKKLPALHPLTWATDLLQGSVCSLDDVALFICSGWSLWTSRNGREHGRSGWHPIGAAKHVANLVEELLCLGHRVEPPVMQQKEHWRAPDGDWVKVNSDGSFDGRLGGGAGAAVIRDHHGMLLAAHARWYGPI